MESKFYMPSFCLEELSIFPDDHMKMAYAVVCFADLLPEEIQNHMQRFHSDSYLRMSKEWAVKNNVSPVIYYTDKSIMANYLRYVIQFASELFVNKNIGKPLRVEELKFTNSTQMIMAYLKQYEGRYFVKSQNVFSDVTNFYIEREWRYVPTPQNYEAFYLDEKDFYNLELKKNKQTELIDNGYALYFGWTDIERIGIPKAKAESFIALLSKQNNLTREEIMNKTHLLSPDSNNDTQL